MVDARFVKLIDFLLSCDTGVLYFCTAGKDRTGVVSAALLYELGMTDEYIIKDYMMSKCNLKAALDDLARQNPAIDIEVITPSEDYIKQFLLWYKAR